MALERAREVPAVGAEELVDLLPEVVGDLLGPVGERRLDVARRAVELAADEVGVGPRLLAIEDARADLDRVDHRPHRVVAGLLTLADEPHRRLVVNNQSVDREAVADRADMRLSQGRGGFHDSFSRYVGGRTERARHHIGRMANRHTCVQYLRACKRLLLPRKQLI